MKTKLTLSLLASLLSGLLGISSAMAMDATPTNPAMFKGKPYSPYANQNFPTKVLFGDVHVHTAISADAGGSGTRLMPRDAYRFARGEQLMSNSGQPIRISQPYDFMAVADHTDGMGMIGDVLAGAPNIMTDPFGRELNAAFNEGGEAAKEAMFKLIATFSQGELSETLNYTTNFKEENTMGIGKKTLKRKVKKTANNGVDELLGDGDDKKLKETGKKKNKIRR